MSGVTTLEHELAAAGLNSSRSDPYLVGLSVVLLTILGTGHDRHGSARLLEHVDKLREAIHGPQSVDHYTIEQCIRAAMQLTGMGGARMAQGQRLLTETDHARLSTKNCGRLATTWGIFPLPRRALDRWHEAATLCVTDGVDACRAHLEGWTIDDVWVPPHKRAGTRRNASPWEAAPTAWETWLQANRDDLTDAQLIALDVAIELGAQAPGLGIHTAYMLGRTDDNTLRWHVRRREWVSAPDGTLFKTARGVRRSANLEATLNLQWSTVDAKVVLLEVQQVVHQADVIEERS